MTSAPEPVAPLTAASRPPAAALFQVALGSLLLFAIAVRAPLLRNADALFNSDESVDALVTKHLLEGSYLGVHNWDATSYGIVENLAAIPFVLLLGFTPLAFRLATVSLWLAAILAVYALAARLCGPRRGLVAAAAVAVGSPQLVLYSGLAAGGYPLVVLGGALAFSALDRLLRRRDLPSAALLGLCLGFGLYAYSLFLVTVASLAASAAAVWLAQARRPGRRDGPRAQAAAGSARRFAALAAVFVAAFLVGFLPKLQAVVRGETGTVRISYAPATPAQVSENARTVATVVLPALFGANVGTTPEMDTYLGPPGPLGPVPGLAFAAAVAAAWGVAVRRLLREGIAASGASLAPHLVALPLANLAMVVGTTNPVVLLSTRYFLPSVPALAVLLAAALPSPRTRVARAAAGLVLAALLLVAPAAQTWRWYLSGGLVDAGGLPATPPDPVGDLIAFLRREGIRTGYSSYWVSYVVTMRTGEAIRLGTFRDWDRQPAYTRAADDDPSAAYVFPEGDPRLLEVVRLAESLGRSPRQDRIGPYVVLRAAPGSGRLLPPGL